MKYNPKVQKKNPHIGLKVAIGVAGLLILAVLGFIAIAIIDWYGASIERQQIVSENVIKDPETGAYPITNSNLQSIIDNEKTALVYFGRPTCPHCQQFMPVLKSVLSQRNLNVYYYNTDAGRADNADLMIQLLGELNVSSVPTFMKIENGVERTRLDTKDEHSLIEFIEQNK